jgi:Leucine-rich repeat (LRR) protein
VGQVSLSELRAAHNAIASLPPEIKHLTALTQLFISENMVRARRRCCFYGYG